MIANAKQSIVRAIEEFDAEGQNLRMRINQNKTIYTKTGKEVDNN